MGTLFVAVRAIHYASAMLLFGEILFALAVAGPAMRGTGTGRDEFGRRLVRIACWGAVAGVASGIAWFAIGATIMSGTTIGQATQRSVLELVLSSTRFGHVWVLRFALLGALCVMLYALRKSASNPFRSRITLGLLGTAALYLGTLAWTGHAAAGEGSDGEVETAWDVVHLLASGAWLGALPGLVSVLGGTQAPGVAARVATRFSTLGAIAVTLISASGLANAWYLIGDVPALFGTDYGRLLLAKLALFAAMLILAMINRWHLSMRLPSEDGEARRLLRRNALCEIAAGIGVVTIVGAMGITVPAAHQVPVWPFEHTWSFEPVSDSAWRQLILAAAGALAVVSSGIALAGFRAGLIHAASGRRRAPGYASVAPRAAPPRGSSLRLALPGALTRQTIAGLAGLAASVGLLAWLLTVPAHPTTYAASPAPYTTDNIVRGGELYAANCRSCHGVEGRGGGAVDRSLPGKPKDLALQSARHRDGDVFWWIAHGIPESPMPRFAPDIRDADIWRLIQFLHAQADARYLPSLVDGMQALPFIAAPDFTFEIGGQSQETLRQLRSNAVPMLVFYTLPQSLPRLRALARDASSLAKAGARIIAVPVHPSSGATASVDAASAAGIIATTGASVAAAYMMFARERDGAADDVPRHVEFLIDRQGDLRFRWSGDALAQTEGTSETRNRIDLLNREPPRQESAPGHAHR